MNKERKILIFDIECDSLTPTKIWCLSCCYLDKEGNWSMKSTHDYDEMRKFFSSEDSYYIGHNIIRFDIPVIQRLLNITIPKSSKCADTLTTSWYIFHDRKEHNLDSWGVTIGIPKIEINDDEWEGLPIERYIERCEVDVKITTNVWVRCFQKLLELYGTPEKAYRLIDYLSNKMYAAHLAEVSRWKLDVKLCEKNLLFLEQELESSVSALKVSMPPVLKKNSVKVLKKPNSLYLKSGKMSKDAESWLNTLKELNLPLDHEGDIEMGGRFEPANPQSSQQRKDWLLSLNWIPQTYKTVTDKDGNKKDIPQIMKNGEPCESVVELAQTYPEVNALLNVGVLVHRTAMLRRWLKDVSEDGYMVAQIMGITNTNRFIHSGLVNIPRNLSPFGKYLRSCLIAEDDTLELCGCDLVSLESLTKLSYCRPFDPRMVEEELKPDFDANLSLAVTNNAITVVEERLYKKLKATPKEEITKEEKAEYDRLDKIRAVYKLANYLQTYGGGAELLAKNAKIPLKEAKAIRQAFWKKNWSVKKSAASFETKETSTGTWILNPVSQFWHSLRSEKDKFSTVNSSTGVYCFDLFVHNILSKRPYGYLAQFHDEVILQVKKGYRDEVRKLLQDAIDKVNREVRLNVELSISIEFGNNYADVH